MSSALPKELQDLHGAIQALKDAWLCRNMSAIGERWKAALAAAREVQAWRLLDSQRQSASDGKKSTLAARNRIAARTIEQRVLADSRWPTELVVSALGKGMTGLLEFIAKLEDPAYAG